MGQSDTDNRRSNEKRRKEWKSTFFEVTSDPSNPPLRSVGFLFSFDYYIISPLSRLCKKFARVPTELFCNCLAHGERPLQHESSLGKPEAKPGITERSWFQRVCYRNRLYSCISIYNLCIFYTYLYTYIYIYKIIHAFDRIKYIYI